ncbi:SPARC-like protein 1 isoform X1 [Hippopotamus amphibius kiboko]|uniref:SPARC-like protein 1 isoform X1 n=2 Tax=Hippopotamus amphibius kiboko TaxID=575201 RepID=UPI0025922314|nr:SPARC-like protein 1 isoform X1 [Hippopotamus amphibius kiboko]
MGQRSTKMKTVIFFIFILGTAAAIPTQARFLSDHSNPTADSLSSLQKAEMLVTSEHTAIPIVRAEDAENERETEVSIEDHPTHKPEKSSVLKSKEENHDQSAEQDQSYSQNLGLQDQEKSESDLIENLEYTPTEGALDLKEDMSEPQKEKPPESFPGHDVSAIVDSNPQESITETEEPINDSHPQLNRSSKHSQDLSVPGNQEQDPNGGEEGEEEPGEVGTHTDNQEGERDGPKEHAHSTQEEDSAQSDDILEASYQPTQVSEMQKDESEQGSQEREEGNSNAEVEGEAASKINMPNQDTEWQGQEGKPGLEVIQGGNHEEMDKKALSEPLLVEPTGDANIMPRNHRAGDDGDDGPRHNASEDYFITSEAFLESERAQSNYYHIKYEEQREKAHENENVDTSEPVENQGAKNTDSSRNEDDSSTEGNTRVHSVDSCMNFQCKRGHVCKADQQGKPHCVCQDPVTCPPTKLLDQVCGTDNQTYASSCHLFATKCRLEGTKKGHQLQLDYFGACKSIPACTDFEVNQFPLRMRDWLKNILMQLYEPNPEHAGYLNEKQRNKVKKIYLDEKRLLAGDHSIDLLLRDFKKNYHMYVYPVHWQFSELDQHPRDRVLTHSELAPLRASLVPMEHCITRFFEECDPNKDKHITLREWGRCFDIKEEDIDENLLF